MKLCSVQCLKRQGDALTAADAQSHDAAPQLVSRME
jgi:hypothetical protein